MRGARGQSSVEYVATVALVAAVLAAVATAVAAPGLPRAVLAGLRLGLCLVAADVCTPEDQARELGPCPMERLGEDLEAGPTMLSVHVGGGNGTAVERLSDDTFMYWRYKSLGAGLSGGAGVQLGRGARAGAGGSVSVGFRAGEGWWIPSALLLRRFDRMEDKPEPTIRYVEGGPSAQVEGSIGIGDAERESALGAGGGAARAAIGRRVGPEGTTWYFEQGAELRAGLAQSIPLFDAGSAMVVEWRTSDPPVITVRETRGTGARVVETVGRMTLSDPADRAAAIRFGVAQASPVAARLAAGDFARRLRARGTVQRFTFDERAEQDGWNASASLGVEVGARAERRTHRRVLVGAEVLSGAFPGRRADCARKEGLHAAADRQRIAT